MMRMYLGVCVCKFVCMCVYVCKFVSTYVGTCIHVRIIMCVSGRRRGEEEEEARITKPCAWITD